jgi:hypothetical protein
MITEHIVNFERRVHSQPLVETVQIAVQGHLSIVWQLAPLCILDEDHSNQGTAHRRPLTPV